jgi:hypothetical protein
VPVPPVAAPAAAPAPSPAAKRTFADALRRRAAHDGAAAPPARAAAAALEDLDRARRRLDAILEAARSGRTFTAQELLGLQASAYRYAQTVDLASKVVESGAQSVKQALHTQV